MKGTKLKRVKNGVKWILPFYLFTFLPFLASAQTLLSLDSCRAMALRNNKQLGVAELKQDVAHNLKRSARTKYLPHVSAIGTYQWTSEELSLLNDHQKSSISNMGTNAVGSLQGFGTGLQTQLGQLGQMLGQLGLPMEAFQQMATQMQQQMGQTLTNTAGLLNTEGQKIVDAFRTDTRNIFAGSVLVTQPVFMGGAIMAMNKVADINETMMQNSVDARRQAVVYATDQAYWQVVSLKHKQRLAESFLEVVKKLDSDVQKMIQEGVATRSEGLSVSVKVNEAEMTVQKVNDGLVLSKMLLCKEIGLPIDTEITLADEDAQELAVVAMQPQLDVEQAVANRPELKMLDNAVDISRQTTNILKAGNLPQVALTGGYAISNPNVLNGFEKKFGGFWNVGLLVRIPIWNWGDVAYKVRASKSATAIATLELDEARDLIELQVNQSAFKVGEANKRLAMAQSNIERAEENLRVANLGFQEGVITPTTVMEAQTAWLQAQSQMIDAEIDVRLSQVDLQKALGTLEIEN
ncbi:MAG: TolC family protein [Prevotella sp.]|nr:TolC family protein [Prevotella sp.]